MSRYESELTITELVTPEMARKHRDRLERMEKKIETLNEEEIERRLNKLAT